ncbi:xanthine dehydrogenase small subunit [Paraglaciecola sp. 20A4]|uniref:xanthine dehydrogenase small subunit n=1 Tax=Paraglaciecola sp. 20A4 TaxID=2687288 RepID=UPI00140C0C97|nr:xanthine dehydrogenase small subunit [Paraglaciecola sp. 20A4]
MISFLLNDKAVHIDATQADTTLLNYLRDDCRLSGTKEGCASGDCGACTVVIAQANDHGSALEYRALNSCVTFLSAIHGKQLLTVEHLADGDKLHPVQAAMVDAHGSQCGFCTPGFVMSMFALYQQGEVPNREQINIALGGNLCRCTGYRPIIDAAVASCTGTIDDKFSQSQITTLTQLTQLNMSKAGLDNLLMPTSRAELAHVIQTHPNGRKFAGSTDLALEVTQQLKSLPTLISLTNVAELHVLHETDSGLNIGAAVPLSKMETLLLSHFPELHELLDRFASTPIRNQATLGGNVANASPIGDMPPALLALNARVKVDNGSTRRDIPINEFFTGYRQTLLQKDEWIEAIFIPYKKPNSKISAYKISKRQEDDISAVCAVFNLTIDNDNVIQDVSSGFGGVAATPASATDLRAAIVGKDWSQSATFEAGKNALSQAFNPIDDVRASADYRQTMIVNLWKRFWLQSNQQNHKIETRVHAYE